MGNKSSSQPNSKTCLACLDRRPNNDDPKHGGSNPNITAKNSAYFRDESKINKKSKSIKIDIQNQKQ